MLDIQLVYARDPHQQLRYNLSVPRGCTLIQAIQLSNILVECPEIQFNTGLEAPHSVGIWYKAANLDDELKAGDRIEIYRPLHLSAMDARKVRHKKEIG